MGTVNNSPIYCVYKHTAPNSKIYIGITSLNPVVRWGSNGAGYHRQAHFYNAILKYGWDNIKHEILFTGLTKEKAEQKEIELIVEYKSNQKEFGYNVDNGGNASGSRSEETKRKIAEAHKRENMSTKQLEALKRPHSEETKRRQSEALKGRVFSEEWKAKLKTAKQGKNNPRAKAVICIETNEYFECIAVAAEKYHIARTHICNVCRGVKKTAAGYHWRYAE